MLSVVSSSLLVVLALNSILLLVHSSPSSTLITIPFLPPSPPFPSHLLSPLLLPVLLSKKMAPLAKVIASNPPPSVLSTTDLSVPPLVALPSLPPLLLSVLNIVLILSSPPSPPSILKSTVLPIKSIPFIDFPCPLSLFSSVLYFGYLVILLTDFSYSFSVNRLCFIL